MQEGAHVTNPYAGAAHYRSTPNKIRGLPQVHFLPAMGNHSFQKKKTKHKLELFDLLILFQKTLLFVNMNRYYHHVNVASWLRVTAQGFLESHSLCHIVLAIKDIACLLWHNHLKWPETIDMWGGKKIKRKWKTHNTLSTSHLYLQSLLQWLSSTVTARFGAVGSSPLAPDLVWREQNCTVHRELGRRTQKERNMNTKSAQSDNPPSTKHPPNARDQVSKQTSGMYAQVFINTYLLFLPNVTMSWSFRREQDSLQNILCHFLPWNALTVNNVQPFLNGNIKGGGKSTQSHLQSQEERLLDSGTEKPERMHAEGLRRDVSSVSIHHSLNISLPSYFEFLFIQIATFWGVFFLYHAVVSLVPKLCKIQRALH